jgi:hypothetical protein
MVDDDGSQMIEFAEFLLLKEVIYLKKEGELLMMDQEQFLNFLKI